MSRENKSSYIKNLFGNKKLVVLIVIAALFIAVAIYTYLTYIKPRINAAYVPNKEFVQSDSSITESADLYFFYTNWCPHCKTAKPIMSKLEEYLNTRNNNINGVNINYIAVDCEEDTETANKFKVEGYPTIKLVNGSKLIEYDAKPDVDTLKQFLESSL